MAAHKILILTRFCNFKQLFCDVRYGLFLKRCVVVAHLAPHMESALISVESECLLFSKFFKVALPLVCSFIKYFG